MVLLFDPDFKGFSKERIWKEWLLFSVLFSVEMCVFLLTDRQIHNISTLFIMVYFTVCSVMDVLLFQVNDFMQFVGIIAGGIRLAAGMPSERIGIGLILFALIQYFVFRRLYGTADCMGFIICSLFSAGRGLGMESYLTSMLFCFCLKSRVFRWFNERFIDIILHISHYYD